MVFEQFTRCPGFKPTLLPFSLRLRFPDASAFFPSMVVARVTAPWEGAAVDSTILFSTCLPVSLFLGRLEFAASSVGACELLALPVIVILTVESRETFKLLWVVTSGSGGVDHTTRKAGEWRSLCVWLTVSA